MQVRAHIVNMTTKHVLVCQQYVCLSAMYATVRVFQALNKIICGFFPPVSSKQVLAFGCGVEVVLMQWKKKETVFLLGGLFGKTAALPTAASLQKALKERSPLLSLNHSIPLNELLPLIFRNTSPALTQPLLSNRTAPELRSGLYPSPWEMFNQGALSPPTYTECFKNFNILAFFDFIISL